MDRDSEPRVPKSSQSLWATEPYNTPRSQKLSRYAAVSKSWQFVVERYIFAAFKVSSNNFVLFRQIFDTRPERKKLVKELFYQIDLPTYRKIRENCFERPSEHQANITAFARGLKELWAELSLWDHDQGPVGMRLVLSAKASISGEQNPFAEESRVDRWSYPEHSLTLPGGVDIGMPTLPNLPRITSLHFSCTGRRIHPTTVGTILNTLPNIRYLTLVIFPVIQR
ncbi:hypothetical protein BDW74DRAFT_174432 [Aspergillus multicolor]|uniref:uncharacterized protein n=1 Tax=Aspergillus multicolor TaxID=41759 RepID=UPI003CCDABE5